MGRMSTMGRQGDVKVEWNPGVPAEVKVAEAAFKENRKQGFKAFRIYGDGRLRGELEKFDKYAERILFVPPMVGG